MEVEEMDTFKLANNENDANISNTTDKANLPRDKTALINNDDDSRISVSQFSESINNYDTSCHENVTNSKKHKSRKFNIIDSDSNDEGVDLKTTESVTFNCEPPNKDKAINTNKEALNDDEENLNDKVAQNNSEELLNNNMKKKPKRLLICDSDSGDEIIHDESTKNDFNQNTSIIYKTNEKGELIAENLGQIGTYQNSRLSALCDPDSSEEERCRPVNENDHSENFTAKKYKKRKSSKLDENNKKQMTGKQALEQRKEIQSESQRMLRERQVSLPYHRPKTRTLKEFLQERPRFAAGLPKVASFTPPSVAIKMSMEELEIVSKKLQEREKELEAFFKSESESEAENEVVDASGIEEEEITSKDKLHNEQEILHENTLNEIQSATMQGTASPVAPIIQLPDNSNTENINTLNPTLNDLSTKFDSGIYDMQIDHNETSTEAADVSANKNQINSDNVEESVHKSGTTEYDFNLNNDNFGEETHIGKDHSEEQVERLLKKYGGCNEKDHLDNSVGDEANIEVSLGKGNETNVAVAQKKNKFDLLREKLGNSIPRLSGGPDQVIDLDDGVIQPNAISKLMERFVKHVSKETHHKNKVKLDIVSVSGGEIHKETVAISVEDEDEPVSIIEKPGAKLQKLRCELEQQMAQRRSAIWQQKASLTDKCDDVNHKEISECGGEDDILDDEDEGELTDHETDEEEEIDDDVVEKPRKKSEFLDEEAEVSEDDIELDENMEDVDNNKYDGEEGNVDGDENSDNDSDNDADDDENDENTNDNVGKHKKKKMRRILRPFSNDSDEENNIEFVPPIQSNLRKAEPKYISKDCVLDSTDTWDEYGGPTPHQRRTEHTPTRQMTQSKSELGFLTPVAHLTGLQSLNSGSKFLRESPVSPFVMPLESSPIGDSFTQKQQGLQKKLFLDTDLSNTQVIDELADICSGQFHTQDGSFTRPQNDKSSDSPLTAKSTEISTSPSTIQTENIKNINEDPSTQDLLEICSGRFTAITQPPRTTLEKQTSENITRDTSSKENESQPTQIYIDSEKEIKDLNNSNEDKLISQLLDEDEMEKFKQKFDSPIDECSGNSRPDSLTKIGRFICDSSEDEDEGVTKPQKKKPQKKLVFSDDEDDENDDEEAIDLHDEDDDGSEGEVRNVEYDSEENEIDVNDEGDVKKRFKVSDFVEKEAELSESEWGSADEDEKGLDELEFELGDTEKFDENKVRRDLERIHMRQVLDEDNYEVKMLQELLLDDGELHGAGRQRQFKWKHIDSMGNDAGEPRKEEDGETYLDDENEETFRKMRYEREIFLKQQEKSREDDDIPLSNDSLVLKLGHAAIKRSMSNSQHNTPTDKSMQNQTESSPGIKQPLTLLNKRGSFLSRSDRFLARVAEFTKVTSATVGGAKNSRNFVFQSVSVNTQTSTDKKRKATDGTPTAIKKLRLGNLSPAVQKKVEKNNRVKNLFSNL